MGFPHPRLLSLKVVYQKGPILWPPLGVSLAHEWASKLFQAKNQLDQIPVMRLESESGRLL